MTEPAADAASLAHFQLFALDGKSDIRWRLLSANNRELGRGYSMHPSAEDCLNAMRLMLGALEELIPLTRRRDGNLWQWALLADGVPVAISGHGYDRQVRSQEAAVRFRSQAALARIGESITHTGARRWVRPASSQLRLPHR
jgi:hypothetical protein